MGIPTLLLPVALLVLNVRNWVALLGFTLVGWVIFITLYEYWRGIPARQKAQGENFFTAISRLTRAATDDGMVVISSILPWW